MHKATIKSKRKKQPTSVLNDTKKFTREQIDNFSKLRNLVHKVRVICAKDKVKYF